MKENTRMDDGHKKGEGKDSHKSRMYFFVRKHKVNLVRKDFNSSLYKISSNTPKMLFISQVED